MKSKTELGRIVDETYSSFMEEIENIRADPGSFQVQTIADLEDNLARYEASMNRLSIAVSSAGIVSKKGMEYARRCEKYYERLTTIFNCRINQIREKYNYLFRGFSPN